MHCLLSLQLTKTQIEKIAVSGVTLCLNADCCLQVVIRDGSEAINCADMLPRRWGNYMRGTDSA